MFSKVIQTILVSIMLTFNLVFGVISIAISWGMFLVMVPVFVFYYPFMWVANKVVGKKSLN